MKKLTISIFAIIALITFGSCDTRRTIYPESGVWVVANLDWSDLGSTPNGATIKFYPQTRTDEFDVVTLRTNSTVDSTFINRDIYNIIVMNETVDSHSNISFSGSDSYDTFVASITSVTNTNPNGEQVITGGEPDDFATINQEDFEVTRQSVIDEVRYELFFTPKMLTKNICATIYITGIDNLRSATQALIIDGMAGKLSVKDGQPTGDTTNHYLIFTEKVLDEGSYTRGYIRGSVNCFGVAGSSNTVTLCVALRDGSMYYIEDIDVTDKIYVDANNDLQLYLDLEEITLPDVEDIYNPSSGFDAEVNDWEEEEDIFLPVV